MRTLVRVVLGCRRAAAGQQPSGLDAAQLFRPATTASAVSGQTSEGDVDMDRQDEEQDEPAGDHAVWDVLSLALGVLANLAESADDDVRVRVRELRASKLSLPFTSLSQRADSLSFSLAGLSSSCHENRKCARKCQCTLVGEAEPSSALEILAQLALDPLVDSPNSVRLALFSLRSISGTMLTLFSCAQVYHHSITGFLRLLLGLLVLDSPQNEELVLGALSHTPSALAPVLDALEELASLHDDQRRAQDELALAAPEEEDDDLVGASQRTEVDETQLAEGDVLMDEVGMARSGTSEEDGLPKRMRELVQRLRRRIS